MEILTEWGFAAALALAAVGSALGAGSAGMAAVGAAALALDAFALSFFHLPEGRISLVHKKFITPEQGGSFHGLRKGSSFFRNSG